MKPPLRSDEGPEAWISYHPLEADFRMRQAMQDYLNRESILSHLPFVFEQDKKMTVVLRSREISREPVPKEMSLIVLESQVTFPENKTSGVKTKKHRQQKRSTTMEAKKEKDFPNWLKYLVAAVGILLICIILVIAICWGVWSYNKVSELKDMSAKLTSVSKELEDCKKSVPAAKPLPTQAPSAAAPASAPRKEEKEKEVATVNPYNVLMFDNRTGHKVPVVYYEVSLGRNINALVKAKGDAPCNGCVDGLTVQSQATNFWLDGKPKHVKFKGVRGGSKTYVIGG